MNDERLQELIDRQDIIDVALDYAHALDTRDYTALLQCFTPDAIYGERCGHGEIEAIARAALEPLDGSQHMTTNFRVQIHGNSAQMTCYFHAQHIREAAPGGPHFIIAGTYEDSFVRTVEGWKIQSRLLFPLWRTGNPRVLDVPVK